jgi:hypothetical protein
MRDAEPPFPLPPAMTVADISTAIYPDEALKQLLSLSGHILRGIIEQILGGNRFIVLVPERRLLLRVAVHGLLPISPSDLYGRNATMYCQRKYLNRDVEFEVHEVDRSGGFLANMTVVGAAGDRIDIAKALLLEGLAEVHKRTVKDIPNLDELVAAQEAAKAMGMGKWSDAGVDQLKLEFDKFYPVRVVEVISAEVLIVQLLQAAIKEIGLLLPSATQPVDTVRTGDLLCVLIDGVRYRARVEKVGEDDVTANLIDFDVPVKVAKQHLFQLPLRLMAIEPQAIMVKLAFVTDQGKAVADTEFVAKVTKDVEMFMNLVYVKDLPAVLLFDKPGLDAGSLNAVVVQKTGVVVQDLQIDLEEEYGQIVERLRGIPRPDRMAE